MAKDNDIVVSSRIRLARNLCKYPFVGRMSSEQKKSAAEEIKNALINSNSSIAKDFQFIHMDNQSDIKAISMVEKHLISPEFANDRKDRGLLINSAKNVSIMINEEDHLRIQCMGKGFMLDELLDFADKLDDLLDSSLNYAFDEKLGFLTHCPTNLGTGLRASVMLHLPALTEGGLIGKIINAVSKFGITVRGMYGEGSEANANLYQVSNQVTLGITEKETIEKLKEIAVLVIEKERAARNALLEANKLALEDRVFRALGTLKSARVLSSEEFLRLISDIRLGSATALIDSISTDEIDEIIVQAQPAGIMEKEGKALSSYERDVKRAELVRNTIMNYEL